MFVLLKVIEWLLNPSTVVVLTVSAGCLMQWREGLRRAGRLVTSAGAVMLLLLWCGFPSNAIGRLLETRYQPIADLHAIAPAPWIVVLGAGHRSESDVPVSSRPNGAGLSRTLEGLRLLNAIPRSRLLLSGGAVFDSVSEARVRLDLARSLGVPDAAMRISERGRTTAEEADAVRGIVGEVPFILVTSALHMPRAMMLFRSRGMHPIPAPTDYQTPLPPTQAASHIQLADDTVHELFGLAWAWVRRSAASH